MSGFFLREEAAQGCAGGDGVDGAVGLGIADFFASGGFLPEGLLSRHHQTNGNFVTKFVTLLLRHIPLALKMKWLSGYYRHVVSSKDSIHFIKQQTDIDFLI